MAFKIGDKIEIKKPKQEEQETKYESILKDAIEILKNKKIVESQKIDVAEMTVSVLEDWFTKEDRKACLYSKKNFIPILRDLVKEASVEFMGDFYDIYKSL